MDTSMKGRRRSFLCTYPEAAKETAVSYANLTLKKGLPPLLDRGRFLTVPHSKIKNQSKTQNKKPKRRHSSREEYNGSLTTGQAIGTDKKSLVAITSSLNT